MNYYAHFHFFKVHLFTSHIIYIDNASTLLETAFTKPILAIVHEKTSSKRVCNSLLNLVKSNYVKFVKDKQQVRVKAYLYIAHHILYVHCMYQQAILQPANVDDPISLPPLDLQQLLAQVQIHERFKYLIQVLIKEKKQCAYGEEKMVPRMPHFEIFFAITFNILRKWGQGEAKHSAVKYEVLDGIFNDTIEISGLNKNKVLL